MDCIGMRKDQRAEENVLTKAPRVPKPLDPMFASMLLRDRRLVGDVPADG
jgi:hypothetical protein